MGEQQPQTKPPLEFTPDSGQLDIPAARERYSEQVDIFMSAFWQKHVDDAVKNQVKGYADQVGGHRQAESVDVWDAVQQTVAHTIALDLFNNLSDHMTNGNKPIEEMDAFDTALTLASWDIQGKPGIQGPDSAYLNVGGDLDQCIDTGALNNPEVRAKASQTISLLVDTGLYKLYKWRTSAQLKTALTLMEQYTQWVPDFDPNSAGWEAAMVVLVAAKAAIKLDFQSKPNLPQARPERSALARNIDTGFDLLGRTQAHMFLRGCTIELPPLQAPSDSTSDSPRAS